MWHKRWSHCHLKWRKKITGSYTEAASFNVIIYKNGNFLERKRKRGAAELPSCARRRAGGQRMAGGCRLREPCALGAAPWRNLEVLPCLPVKSWAGRGVSGWDFSGGHCRWAWRTVRLPFQATFRWCLIRRRPNWWRYCSYSIFLFLFGNNCLNID